LAAGANVKTNDPVAMHEAKHILTHTVTYCEKQEDALIDADALLIITEWPEYRSPDFDELKSKLKNPVIFDGRNIYDAEELRQLGFSYYGIGVN
jgi:UDPglucose 6-dehydrogenase